MNYGIYLQGNVLVNEKGEPLTNFSFQNPEKFYKVEDEHTVEMMRLTIQCIGLTQQLDLDLKEPSLLSQIQREIPTCKVLIPKMRPCIEAYLLELRPKPSRYSGLPPLYFRQHGFHKLANGDYVFVSGDEVLGLSDRRFAIARKVARAHLAYDKEMHARQAVQGLWKILEKSKKVLLMVWGFTLLCSMRSVLSKLNITTYPACAVTGRQGLGKTTTCQRFALLYDDVERPGHRWGEVDAKSTAAATKELISCYRDQPVLLDDISKSISQAQVRERRDLLADVLRFACNDTALNKKDRSGRIIELVCTAGLIYTGEFPLNNPSDIGRVVPVHINKQMQDGKQHDRVVAATAFRYFIQWFLPNVERSVSSLNKDLNAVNGDNQRVQKNRTMILWALQQFLCFAAEIDAVSEQKSEEMMQRAIKICDNVLHKQIEQIKQIEQSDCLSWHILDGIQSGILRRVKIEELEDKDNLPEYYYLKKNDTVYIPMEVLYRYFTKCTSIYLSSSTAMGKRLKTENVIHPGKEGKSATKKINGDRYLELRKVDLMIAAKKESPKA